MREYVLEHLHDEDAVPVVDETGDVKKGTRTVGVQRQYTGTAGRIENAQVAVYLVDAAVRGHAAVDRELYVPRSWTCDPDRCRAAGPGEDTVFATKPELAVRMIGRYFARGDEVYGGCTQLREFFEENGQAYVLRAASSFMITLAPGTKVACAEAVKRLVKDKRRWEVRSAGKGPYGERWYAWAWIGTASPRHHLLVRRHIKTGELAFHYCYVPKDSCWPRPG